MKLEPLIQPLYARARAFHSDPAWASPRVQARLARTRTPAEKTLADLLDAAKAGFVDDLSAVIPLMKQEEDDGFWGRASLLLSSAAPSDVLRLLVHSFTEEMIDRKDPVIQGFIAETLLNSGLLWTVPVALRIMRAQVDRARMFSIPSRLSSLLEPQPGAVFFGPEEIPEDKDLPDWIDQPFTYDDESFEAIVNGLYQRKLEEMGGDPETALLLGARIDIAAMVPDLIMTIGRVEDDDLVARKRVILEGQTGVDLSAFYADDLVLDRMAAMAALEALHDTVDLDSFTPGRRYFFRRMLG